VRMEVYFVSQPLFIRGEVHAEYSVEKFYGCISLLN
jgi:hypothetical protein